MILAFVVWSIVACIFGVIGIRAWQSKEAVGFFTFVEPPAVHDVEKYNHAVSKLWMISAVILELLGVPFLFLEQNSALFIPSYLGVVALVIGMAIAYVLIQSKYQK